MLLEGGVSDPSGGNPNPNSSTGAGVKKKACANTNKIEEINSHHNTVPADDM